MSSVSSGSTDSANSSVPRSSATLTSCRAARRVCPFRPTLQCRGGRCLHAGMSAFYPKPVKIQVRCASDSAGAARASTDRLRASTARAHTFSPVRGALAHGHAHAPRHGHAHAKTLITKFARRPAVGRPSSSSSAARSTSRRRPPPPPPPARRRGAPPRLLPRREGGCLSAGLHRRGLWDGLLLEAPRRPGRPDRPGAAQLGAGQELEGGIRLPIGPRYGPAPGVRRTAFTSTDPVSDSGPALGSTIDPTGSIVYVKAEQGCVSP